ncbi:DUF4115 domain-containing protein [Vibrio sp. SM6]|uniref:DUF4115 domain-containing protein n=1 Tax=Vibrio agarilyticus TaxID=2726741 RepID=A0A7X8TSX5_9VIBR|nr:RodZ domain-containing protein [Vibrio agarilyticus]NLS14285.1 DUF4115 domain-containing protein [Vibrio agarilyticus]
MTTEQTAPQETTPPVEAGTLLKNRREAIGMTQKEVANKLRLRIAVVEQLEANQFKGDQVATFTRGYLRSYAKLVGLDEHVVLSALEQTADVQPQEQVMQSFSRKTSQAQHNSRITWVTWGVFLTIIGISSIWWWQNQQDNSLNVAVATQESAQERAIIEEITVAAPAPAAADISAQPQSRVDNELVLASDSAELNAAPTVTTLVAEPESSAAQLEPTLVTTTSELIDVQPAVIEPSTPATQNGLPVTVMNFTADCWIQVKDANGRVLAEGLKKAGQREEFSGKSPLKVILGAPEGVQMTFASEPVDLSGYTAGKVARFTLP